MKAALDRLLVVLSVLVAILAMLALDGCSSTATPEEKQELADMWSDIWADGVMTPEEQAAFLAKMQAQQPGPIDWPATITSVATAALGVFGVNIYRNRREAKLWGPPQPPGAAPA